MQKTLLMKNSITKLFKTTFKEELDSIEPLKADGSAREYFRVASKTITCIGAYNNNLEENLAFISYSNQLRERGINVPKILAQDLDNHIYLLEDLGDTTLFEVVKSYHRGEISDKEIQELYKRIMDGLVQIQTMASKGFDYGYAYPIKEFNNQAISWDLNYFKYYFLRLADIEFNETRLEQDFDKIKENILDGENNAFLFRDFQSRNIMIKDDEIYFIDYQGGRKGWLEYDIASLLFDAKAELSPEFREYALDYYLEEISKHIDIDREKSKQRFLLSIYIRIMQAMGAYGYRGYFQGKTHFIESIPIALNNLRWLLENMEIPIKVDELKRVFAELVNSKKLKEISNKPLNIDIKSFSYKKGYPHDLSGNGGGFVFDCRAIDNPGRRAEYRELTGRDQEVIDFLESNSGADEFFKNTSALVLQSVKEYQRRGFTNLSVYYGCTGGQHRSVFFAEKLFKLLFNTEGLNLNISHIEQGI